MLMRERLLASKIAVRLREQYQNIDMEVNIYPNDKLVMRFTLDRDNTSLRRKEVVLTDLSNYADEDDMIEDAVILVKRNIKEN